MKFKISQRLVEGSYENDMLQGEAQITYQNKQYTSFWVNDLAVLAVDDMYETDSDKSGI